MKIIGLRMSLVLLGLSIADSAAAQVAFHNDGTTILRNWETGRCLDSNGAGKVYTSPCGNGNRYQSWRRFRYQSRPPLQSATLYVFQNVATGLCLDYWAGGRGLYTSRCRNPSRNNNHYQMWKMTGNTTVARYHHVASAAYRSQRLCLDSDRKGSAYVIGCNGGGFQNWRQGF